LTGSKQRGRILLLFAEGLQMIRLLRRLLVFVLVGSLGLPPVAVFYSSFSWRDDAVRTSAS